MAKMTLGYWDVRGLAEPIRFLLHYKKVAFVDKRYTFESGEWPKEKFNLRLDFPNLPYLTSESVRITQSTTILRYLAKMHKLDGNSEEDKLKVDMVEQQLVDVRWMLIYAVIQKDLESSKANFVGKAPAALKLLEDFLEERDYLVGDSLTYVDFMMSETFDFYRYFVPEIAREFSNLKAHQDRVMALPELQSYLNSTTYKRWPIFGPIAKFGGSGDEPSRD